MSPDGDAHEAAGVTAAGPVRGEPVMPGPGAGVPVVALDGCEGHAADVGAKALALCHARRDGLPALPGAVVPASAGRDLVVQALGASGGGSPHAATLAVMEAAAAYEWTGVVEAARPLGERLVVRSSSPVEGDPSWSGAFSSFLDVAPDEVPTAVAGCWASACAPAVVELCDRMGTTPGDVCPAVLIQPMVDPEAGGIAKAGAAGGAGRAPAVEIAGVEGSPAPLLAGWVRGWSAHVAGGGEGSEPPAVHMPPGAAGAAGRSVAPGDAGEAGKPGGPRGAGGGAPGAPPERWLRAVAGLACRAGKGAPVSIEWAIVEDRPVLLQLRVEPESSAPPADGTRAAHEGAPQPGGAGVRGAPARTPAGGDGDGTDGLAFGLAASPRAPAIARAVLRYGGPIGEELVLPWLLLRSGSARGDEPSLRPTSSPSALPQRFDATVESARALVARALGNGSVDLTSLAEGDPEAFGALVRVPEEEGEAVLAGVAAAAQRLVETGAIAHEDEVWSLTVGEVRARLESARPGAGRPARYRLARWLPLLEAVMQHWGRAARGEAASSGAAAGPARRLGAAEDLRRVARGDVVIVERPLPQLAPSLWAASALVAESGAAAAHLAEVARSLRVPAVVATGALDVTEQRTLVLVDGDEGRVLLLDG